MKSIVKLLVFSDLDGTLIDHDTYQWDAAQPALDALRVVGAGVVLASSKTAAEIVALRDKMGLTQWPAIVENGAGVLEPGVSNTHSDPAYNNIRSELDQLPLALRRHFQGFGDVDIAGLVNMTGLPAEQAGLAKQRAYTEPGVWSGTDAERDQFLRLLSQRGVSAREGGRFLTLSYGKTKADCMQSIIQHYAPRYTVALGDAPNDVEMLQTADFGVIVANPHRKALDRLAGEAEGRIIRTGLAGPSGWNVSILDLLSRLDVS